MVKNLFKYEIKSYLRVWLPAQAILIGIALLGRMIQFFETDTTVYEIISGSSVLTYVVAIIVCIGLTTALSIIRYYKNLFSGEGYLTFTLPVTPSQHIIVKTATAVLFQVLTAIIVLLSGFIITSGELFIEITKAAIYLFNMAYKTIGSHLPFYIIEFLILVLVSCCCQFMHYYTCISIGQLFRKNRILAAVGVYFGFYIITQIISTVISVSMVFLSERMEKILAYIEEHLTGFVHGFLLGGILLCLIGAVVYFIVIKFIISRRLNLE